MTSLEFKKIRKNLKLTQAEMAEKLGIERRTVIKYEQGDVIPESKVKLLNAIIELEQNNVREDLTSALQVHSSNEDGAVIELPDGRFKVYSKKVPAKAYGSYLSDHQDPNFLENLAQVEFLVSHAERDRYICFEAEDESMNGGLIDDTKSGAELLCRQIDREHWKNGFNNSPLGWVIVHMDTVLFKDIKKLNNETGELILSSRSGLPQHSDFTVNIDDVRQIWKVVKRIQD